MSSGVSTRQSALPVTHQSWMHWNQDQVWFASTRVSSVKPVCLLVFFSDPVGDLQNILTSQLSSGPVFATESNDEFFFALVRRPTDTVRDAIPCPPTVGAARRHAGYGDRRGRDGGTGQGQAGCFMFESSRSGMGTLDEETHSWE